MARPQRSRRICSLPACSRFVPADAEHAPAVVLTLDEYETIRLMDREGKTHEQCAAFMQISRTTVTEIYAAARKKLADALVEGCEIVIDGGSVRVCDGTEPCGSGVCPRRFSETTEAKGV